MKRCSLPIFFVFLVSAFLINSAEAHKIRPGAQIDLTKVRQIHHQWIDRWSYPVHEEMALLAEICARQLTDLDSCPTKVSTFELDTMMLDTSNSYVWGVRWNDDPNNQAAGELPLQWLFWLTKAKESKTIKDIDPLVYRSHFGDLQYWHAMASMGDLPTKTKESILQWMRFTYDVATGVIDLDIKLVDLTNEYLFADAIRGGSRKNWTVKKLFLNFFDYRDLTPPESWSKLEVRKIALGALLHTIHDSYSATHVKREIESKSGLPSRGPIKTFLDYRSQNAECHAVADAEPAWLKSADFKEMDGPVYHSAWIIRRALLKKKWKEEGIETYLRDVVFLLSSDPEPANAGACKKK